MAARMIKRLVAWWTRHGSKCPDTGPARTVSGSEAHHDTPPGDEVITSERTTSPSARPARVTRPPWSRTRPRPWARATGAAARAPSASWACSRSTATRSSPRAGAACCCRITRPGSRARASSRPRPAIPPPGLPALGHRLQLPHEQALLAAVGRGQLRVLDERVAARPGHQRVLSRGPGRPAGDRLHARGFVRPLDLSKHSFLEALIALGLNLDVDQHPDVLTAGVSATAIAFFAGPPQR